MTQDKTAEEVLKQSIPKDCIWIYSVSGQGDWTLVNTPSRYVTQAMESYASQKTSSLESENKRLEELVKAADEIINQSAPIWRSDSDRWDQYFELTKNYQALKTK